MQINYGTQRDIETGRYFFIIYDDADDIEFESEAAYASEEEADAAAEVWIKSIS